MPDKFRFPAVIFDLDGTLVDSAKQVVKSVRYALLKIDDRETPDADTITLQIGKPLPVMLRELGYPGDQASSDEFVAEFRPHFARQVAESPPPLYPDVEFVLEHLHKSGVGLALVTNKHQTQAELVATRTGLARYLQYVHGWQEGRKPKPDAEPVETALAQLGAEANQGLMVGDSEQDILAARAAGVATCAVTHGFRPTLFLKSLHPDFLISRLTDLLRVVEQN